MWKLTLKGLVAHKARFLLTGLAVILGTGFVAGALTFGDTLEEGFDELFTSLVGAADVVVLSEDGDGGPMAGPGATRSSGLAPETVDRLVALDEVGLAQGEMEGTAILVDDAGQPITQFGPPTIGVNAFEHPELDPAELRAGRWPEVAGEVAVDAGTVRGQGWELGDEVGVVLDGPLESMELVGVFGLGEVDNLAGVSVVVLDAVTAAERLGTGGEFTRIYLAAAEGVGSDALAQVVTAELGDGVRVLTAAEYADDQQALIAPFIEVFTTALLVFALVALLVGSFLIFNTFTIVLAGRLREFALLRAVGAGRGQLLAAVLGEAVIVGMIGGGIGAAFGLAVAVGLQGVLGTIGVELPGEQLVVLPRTVVVAVVVGVVVTVIAAVVPARRAVRIPPVAALTEVAVAAPAGRGVLRTMLGVVLLGAGLTGMAATAFGDAGAAVLGAGAVAVFLGVAALSSLVVRPLARVITWPAARLSVSGMLAGANSVRNPRRTAATASALMIGLALVSFVSVFAASLEATIGRAVDRAFQADAFVRAGTAAGVPDSVVDVLGGVEEVALVAPVGAGPLRIGDDQVFAGVMDPGDLLAVLDLDVVDGDLDAFAGGGLIATQTVAENRGLAAGDRITVTLPRGGVDVEVVALIDGGGIDVSWLIDDATWREGAGEATIFNVYVVFADGVSAQDGIAAVEAALTGYPQVTVFDQAGLVEAIGEQLDALVGAVVALLALSVLVALLGIVNTLALSVVERTREIGLLRAIGMTRTQARRMVRTEGLTVALIGVALGLALGLPIGRALVAVDEFNLDVFAVPWVQIGVGVVVAALAGLLAGALPARRAARLDVLDALHTE